MRSCFLFSALLIVSAVRAQPDSLRADLIWSVKDHSQLSRSVASRSGRFLYSIGNRNMTVFDMESMQNVAVVETPNIYTVFAGPTESIAFGLESISSPSWQMMPFAEKGDTVNGEVLYYSLDSVHVLPGKTVLWQLNVFTGQSAAVDTFENFGGHYTIDPTATRLYEYESVEYGGTHFLQAYDIRSRKWVQTIGHRPVQLRERNVIIDRFGAAFSGMRGLYQLPSSTYVVIVSDDSISGFDIQSARELWTVGVGSRMAPIAVTPTSFSFLIPCESDTLISIRLRDGHQQRSWHARMPIVARFLDPQRLVGRNQRHSQYRSIYSDTLVVYDLDNNSWKNVGLVSSTAEILRVSGDRVLLGERGRAFEFVNVITGRRDTIGWTGGTPSSFAFSKTHNVLAFEVYHQGYRFVDPISRQPQREWYCPITWNTALSPDGRYLAVGENNDRLVLWDLDRRDTLFTADHKYYPHNVSFSPDSKLIALPSNGLQRTSIFDLAGNERFIGEPVTTWNNLAFFSADSQYLIATLRDSLLYYRLSDSSLAIISAIGHGVITDVAFSHNDKWMATATSDHAVQLWDTRTRTIRQSFDASTGSQRLAFSPNDRFLIICRNNGIIPIDISTGAALGVMCEMPLSVTAFSFSDDGCQLVIGDSAGDMSLYWTPRLLKQ